MPSAFVKVVKRQSERRNEVVFNAARPDVIMQPSAIIASKVQALIHNPLMGDFLRLVRAHDETWAAYLVFQHNCGQPKT